MADTLDTFTAATVIGDTDLLHLKVGTGVSSDKKITGVNAKASLHDGVDTIQFNTSFANGNAEGRLQWNSADGTLEYGLAGGVVNLQIGQEQVVRVRNNTGVQIDNGSVVYVSGSHSSDVLEVSLAQADDIATTLAIGITTEDISDSGFGYVSTFGIVREIDTDGFTEGAPLFLSETVAGAYQQDRPLTGSAYVVFIGFVIKAHATEGEIATHINIIPRLDRLSGVEFADPSDGDALRFVSANSQYEFYTPVTNPMTADLDFGTFDLRGDNPHIWNDTSTSFLGLYGGGTEALETASPQIRLYARDSTAGAIAVAGMVRDTDDFPGSVQLQGQGAFVDAVTNLVGGDVELTAGVGAANSAGAADGGSVLIVAGTGFGTGVNGIISVEGYNQEYYLGEDAGATSFTIFNNSGDPLWSVDSLGNITPSSGGFTSIVDDETNGNYAIGLTALDSITVGSGKENIAIGTNAGTAITTGDKNIALGTNALFFASTGIQNVAIGHESQKYSTGSYNTAVGAGTMSDTGTTGGSNSVFGYKAGWQISGGVSNTLLGHQAGQNIEGGDYNIVIGTDAYVSASNAMGEIVIGHSTGNVPYFISGVMGAMYTDIDISSDAVTITGTSAFYNASTNQDGGNLVLQAGQKASGGGVNGLTLVNDGVYGVMSVQANAVAETTTDATPRKIAAFDTDGLANGMTVDSTTGNDITAVVAGTYMVNASCSFEGSASSDFHIELYVDAAATGFEGHRRLGVGGDLGNLGVTGIVALAIGEAVSLFHWSSDGGSSFTCNDAQITIHRISQ